MVLDDYDEDLMSMRNGEMTQQWTGCDSCAHITSKRREIDADMFHLFCQAHKLEYPYSGAPYSNQLSMGGTPLNNVLFWYATCDWEVQSVITTSRRYHLCAWLMVSHHPL